MRNLVLNYLIFGAITLASFVTNNAKDILSLQESGEIELTLKGNSESTHYLKPLTIQAKNTTRKVIEMKIPAGLHFVSHEENTQDILSTQSQMVRIAPNSTKTIDLSGVCIQHSNASPSGNSLFTLSAKAEPKLYELAQFLDDKNIEGSAAQHAAWAISDNNDLSNIIGLDHQHEEELMDKTASILNLPKVPIEEIKKLRQQRVQPTYSSSLKGYFKFEFPRATQVQVAVFNQDHVLIKEVFNAKVQPGFHKVDYELETTEYEGQKIYSQLIAYNKVLSKRSIDLRH